MLLHTDMLQDFRLCQGSLFPKVVRSFVRGLVGSSCCVSSSANSHPPEGNTWIQLKDSHPLVPRTPTASEEQSFFCTKGALAAMIHSTAEGCRLSWAAKSELIFLCFVKETAGYVGNLCPRSALTLLLVPDHTRLGRDSLFIYLSEETKLITAKTAQLTSRTSSPNPWREVSDRPTNKKCFDTIFSQTNQGLLRRSSIAISTSYIWSPGTWWLHDPDKVKWRVWGETHNAVLNIVIQHHGPSYSTWRGI